MDGKEEILEEEIDNEFLEQEPETEEMPQEIEDDETQYNEGNNPRQKLKNITENAKYYKEQGEKLRARRQTKKNLLDKKTEDNEVSDNDNTIPKTDSSIKNDLEKVDKAKAVKSAVSENTSKAVKQGSEVAVKTAKAIASKIGAFLIANPWIVGILIGIGIFSLIIFIVVLNADASSDGITGLNGYTYVDGIDTCSTYTVKDDGSIIDQGVELDDAVAIILAAEISFAVNSMDTLKASAVAIRSFIVYNQGSSCTIDSGQIAYYTSKKEVALSSGSNYLLAANSTTGLILYENNNVIPGYFAAFCYKETVGDNYVIYYGENDCFVNTKLSTDTNTVYSCTDGIFSPKEQSIPISYIDSLSYTVPKSYMTSECNSNHPSGMSQFGSYYLVDELGYTWQETLYYYYGDEVEIVSIYPSGSSDGIYAGGNYTLTTSNGINDQITSALSNYIDVSAYNNYIYEQVSNAGVGTREAVVAAGIGLIGNLYESYGIRLPYVYGGGHGSYGASVSSYYGIDPNWGTKISSTSNFGMDCSSFVYWVLKNAGFKVTPLVAADQSNYGTKYNLSSLPSSYVIQPGDLLYKSNTGSHIMLVVGIDYDAGLIYIAHASSSSTGAKISTVSINSSSYYVVDMSEFYETQNKYTEDEFYNVYYSSLLTS